MCEFSSNYPLILSCNRKSDLLYVTWHQNCIIGYQGIFFHTKLKVLVSNLFTENLATISLHLRWQGGNKQPWHQIWLRSSKLNFISYQRSKSREPNLSQRSKNKATTVTEWPLCRQDSSPFSISLECNFPHLEVRTLHQGLFVCFCERLLSKEIGYP